MTQGDHDLSLKKLNIAGNNLIMPDAYDELCAAVTTGNYKNIYVASIAPVCVELQGFMQEIRKLRRLIYIDLLFVRIQQENTVIILSLHSW